MSNEAPMKLQARWDIEYEHAIGEIATEFFERMRDEATLYGRRCPECEKVFIPPVSFCEQCFCRTSDWVDVGDVGQIHAATVQYHTYENLPDPPYALIRVDLDRADTGLLHRADGDDLDLSDPDVIDGDLAVGTKVRARWKDAEDRTGAITDIEYFEPVE